MKRIKEFGKAVAVVHVALVVGYFVGSHRVRAGPGKKPLSFDSGLPPWPLFTFGTSINAAFSSLAEKSLPPAPRVFELTQGYWRSGVIYALAYHGLPDAIPVNGRRSCDEIAAAKGLVRDFTCRWLRAGAAVGLVQEVAPLAFATTEAGDLLRTSHPSSLRDFVVMLSEERVPAWFAAAKVSPVTGKSGFREAHGAEFFDWVQRPFRNRSLALFDSAMTSVSTVGNAAVVADYFSKTDAKVVCDIGGGSGALLQRIFATRPDLHLMLLDLPDNARRARQSASFPLDAVGGSFFDPFPKALARCDLFVLKHVLHNWNDDKSVEILSRVLHAASSAAASKERKKHFNKPAKLVVVEPLLSDVVSKNDLAGMGRVKQLMDVNMLAVAPAGARERSLADFHALFRRAGLDVNTLRVLPTRSVLSVLELSLPQSIHKGRGG